MKKTKQVKKKTKPKKLPIGEWCETCGTAYGLTASHFLKKNSIANIKEYDYNDRQNYFTQCLTCHMSYEKLNKESRIQFLLDKGFLQYYLRAKRIMR